MYIFSSALTWGLVEVYWKERLVEFPGNERHFRSLDSRGKLIHETEALKMTIKWRQPRQDRVCVR